MDGRRAQHHKIHTVLISFSERQSDMYLSILYEIFNVTTSFKRILFYALVFELLYMSGTFKLLLVTFLDGISVSVTTSRLLHAHDLEYLI
jgi:hypothetical protein